MSKHFVFIDESYSMKKKKTATSHIVVAAVLIVEQEKLSILTDAMNTFRADLGWNELHELKFNSAKKSIIKDFLNYIKQFEFEAHAVVIDRLKIADETLFNTGEDLYNNLVIDLLLKMSLKEPSIVIDGVSDKKQAQRVRTFLRKSLKQHGIEKCKIGFVDSRKNVLIQLIDVITGSIARSYNSSKTDRYDYINIIKPKIKRNI